MVHLPSMALIALIPLLIWRIYSRIKRHLGPQKSILWRHILVVVLYPLVLISLSIHALQYTTSLIGLLSGITLGIALAVYSLRVTRFESVDQNFFYTPSAHIGIALSLILTGRLLYRLYEVCGGGITPEELEGLSESSATLLILGTFFGYYLSYTIGILRLRSRFLMPNHKNE
ncbi:hypothetical protein [Aquirhabdus sp.]|uniref:hypothetical protein n=1 Tax=Aquirhabdus sp. TaxID=2824160 RepID=UPI00396C798D